jgi:hypothetical protein
VFAPVPHVALLAHTTPRTVDRGFSHVILNDPPVSNTACSKRKNDATMPTRHLASRGTAQLRHRGLKSREGAARGTLHDHAAARREMPVAPQPREPPQVRRCSATRYTRCLLLQHPAPAKDPPAPCRRRHLGLSQEPAGSSCGLLRRGSPARRCSFRTGGGASARCSHGVRVVAAAVGGGVEHGAGKDVEHHGCGRGGSWRRRARL